MKRAGKMLVIGLFSLLLSGCMFTTPETSLYRLPKLAGEYEAVSYTHLDVYKRQQHTLLHPR